MSEHRQGLFEKYTVLKDGEPINGPAFVLRYDRDSAARAALRTYADYIEADNPRLANDLRVAISDAEYAEIVAKEWGND